MPCALLRVAEPVSSERQGQSLQGQASARAGTTPQAGGTGAARARLAWTPW